MSYQRNHDDSITVRNQLASFENVSQDSKRNTRKEGWYVLVCAYVSVYACMPHLSYLASVCLLDVLDLKLFLVTLPQGQEVAEHLVVDLDKRNLYGVSPSPISEPVGCFKHHFYSARYHAALGSLHIQHSRKVLHACVHRFLGSASDNFKCCLESVTTSSAVLN